MEYKLYQSQVITSNPSLFIENCGIAYQHFTKLLKTKDSTWSYKEYNFFNLSSSSLLFYSFFKELRGFIRDYIKDDRPLWLESWINYHNNDEVETKLRYHGHDFPYHGYISVNPQETTTIFKNFKIKNKIGQVYIGPGGSNDANEEYNHYVRVDKPYSEPRITIAFNVTDIGDQQTGNLGFFPLL